MAETKVTRISAKDDAPKKKAPVRKTSAKKQPEAPKSTEAKRNPIIRGLLALGGYFKGAWVELRQVRWPTRRATWGLTLAVILFSGFFTVVILLLDLLFKYVFELIIA